MLLLIALSIVFGAIVLAQLRVRGRIEFRARVLETLAAAVRRGVALEPLLVWTASHDHAPRRARFLRAAAMRLEAGEPLSVALVAPLRLPAHTAASLRAAEGTDGLAHALANASRSDGVALATRHRLALAIAYPTMIAVGAIAIARPLTEVFSSMEISGFTARLNSVAGVARAGLYVLGAIVLGVLTWRLAVRLRPSLGAVGRGLLRRPGAPDAARWLAALAPVVRAGLPLGECFERSARAAGHPALERAVIDGAASLCDGVAPCDVWRELPLPAGIRVRAAAAGGTPEALAAALQELSADAAASWLARRERMLALVHPVGLVLAGLVLALFVHTVFAAMGALAGSIGLW